MMSLETEHFCAVVALGVAEKHELKGEERIKALHAARGVYVTLIQPGDRARWIERVENTLKFWGVL